MHLAMLFDLQACHWTLQSWFNLYAFCCIISRYSLLSTCAELTDSFHVTNFTILNSRLWIDGTQLTALDWRHSIHDSESTALNWRLWIDGPQLTALNWRLSIDGTQLTALNWEIDGTQLTALNCFALNWRALNCSALNWRRSIDARRSRAVWKAAQHDYGKFWNVYGFPYRIKT